ncbi:MAG: diaminopimelate decarboxylase [Gemmatimonadota bacterium]
MNGHFEHRHGRLHCEELPVEALVAEHGTPLYVYSRATIEERYRVFAAAFAPADPLVAFSVKSNGNLSILRVLAELGAGADIVSGGELARVRAAGIAPERTVFSGVGKTVTELAAGLEAGIYGFNVESAGELRALSELAVTMGVRAPVALRVNPDIHSPTPHAYTRTGHSQTKFGIPFADAHALYRRAAALPGVEVRGVDVHIGSQILETGPYVAALERVLELVAALRADGISPEYLDLGGGFGIAYQDEAGVDAAGFAAALLPLVERSGMRLVLEPGRFIVGPAGVLLARIVYVKEMGGKTFVITDAGMNDLLRPSHYASYHAVVPALQHPEREPATVDVVGPICESGDFLALDRALERPEPGELLAIGATGAYGFSMASSYNARPRPAEVLVEGGQARLIRRRETHEDLMRGELELLDAPRAAAII